MSCWPGGAEGQVGVVSGAAGPVPKIAIRIRVEIVEIRDAAIDREIIGRQAGIGMDARRRVVKHVQRRVARSTRDGFAEQIDPAHGLGKFVLDDTDEVVYAGNRPVGGVVGVWIRATEPRIPINIGAGLLKGQSQCLGVGRGDPHRPVDRHADWHCRRGGRVDAGKRIFDGRVAVTRKIGLALAQRADLQRLTGYLAIADGDINRDRTCEYAFVVVNHIADGRNEPCR